MPKITLEDAQTLTGLQREWGYNALDVMGTREIFDTLHPRLGPETARTYAFERALQGPAMAMMQTGVLVDEQKRAFRVTELKRELKRIAKAIDILPGVADRWDGHELVTGLCDVDTGKRHKWPRGEPDSPARKCERCHTSRIKRSPFLPSSSKQKCHLFYDLHGVKPILDYKTKKPTTDGDAMEKIGLQKPALKPITDLIDKYQDTQKQIGFLSAPITAAGRYPSTFNIGTAWTGRMSSSKNPYKKGGNLQNVAEQNRDIFIADPGFELFYADLEQAESNFIAHLAGDEAYIEAHKTGDVHTAVAQLIWPELPWEDDREHNKKVAKALPSWDPVPGHDYRFQCKRIQHGGNFGLTPPGIAIIAHIPQAAAQTMYYRYHGRFPGIGRYHRATAADISAHRPLFTPLGRRVKLFGRPDDKHTLKQGYSFRPQGGVADLLDLSMWYAWWELQMKEESIVLLAQVHDALLGMRRKGDDEALRRLKQIMTIPVEVTGVDDVTRIMTLGVEIAVGCNWRKQSPTNPDGLKVWKE